MKNTFKVLGLIALVAVIGFSFVACGGGNDDVSSGSGSGFTGGSNTGGGGNPQTASYTGTSGGQSYSLKITEKTAKYTAKSGDSYELTVGSKKNTGTVVSSAGGVLTLKPSNSSETFTANVSGSALTALNGTITWTDGTTASAPGTLTGSGNSGGDGDNSGSSGGANTTSLDGVWKLSTSDRTSIWGRLITISGSTGILTAFGNPEFMDEWKKSGRINIGDEVLRIGEKDKMSNIWDGQIMTVSYNSKTNAYGYGGFMGIRMGLDYNGKSFNILYYGNGGGYETYNRIE